MTSTNHYANPEPPKHHSTSFIDHDKREGLSQEDFRNLLYTPRSTPSQVTFGKNAPKKASDEFSNPPPPAPKFPQSKNKANDQPARGPPSTSSHHHHGLETPYRDRIKERNTLTFDELKAEVASVLSDTDISKPDHEEPEPRPRGLDFKALKETKFKLHEQNLTHTQPRSKIGEYISVYLASSLSSERGITPNEYFLPGRMSYHYTFQKDYHLGSEVKPIIRIKSHDDAQLKALKYEKALSDILLDKFKEIFNQIRNGMHKSQQVKMKPETLQDNDQNTHKDDDIDIFADAGEYSFAPKAKETMTSRPIHATELFQQSTTMNEDKISSGLEASKAQGMESNKKQHLSELVEKYNKQEENANEYDEYYPDSVNYLEEYGREDSDDEASAKSHPKKRKSTNGSSKQKMNQDMKKINSIFISKYKRSDLVDSSSATKKKNK